MTSDNSLGRAFHGFIEAETPLELDQRTDALITVDEIPIDIIIPPKPEEDDTVESWLDSKRDETKESVRKKLKLFHRLHKAFNRQSEPNKIHEKKTASKAFEEKQQSVRRQSYRPLSFKEIKRDSHKLGTSESLKTIDDSSDEEIHSSSKGSQGDLSVTSTDGSQEFWNVPGNEKESSRESTTIDIPEEHLLLNIQFRTKEVKGYRKRGKGLGKVFSRCCPMLARLLFSKPNDYRGVKAMLGFPIGVLFGYALHKLVLERLKLSPFASDTLGGILALCLGIGYAVSTQVRCICLLTIPNMCGKAGRTYVSTFVITLIITGPIDNILANSQESMRVMSCTASLNFNHTVERFKLMFKPVKEIVWDFVGAGEKINKGTKSIEGAYEAIDKEVRDEEETKMDIAEAKELDEEIDQPSRVDIVKKKFSGIRETFGKKSEAKYGMKSELRCEGIFTKGVKGCYNSFGAAYDRCMGYLPVIGYLLCWPVKLTFICDIASSYVGKRSCDSSDAMSPGFGESMETADGVQREFDKEFGVTMQYKINIPEEKVDQITPQDITASIRHQFEKRKQTLDFFLNMINRLMTFLFLYVFNVSRKYCDRYLRDIEFDNKYITSYFRHIDARRHKQGKQTLFPLKKGEKSELLKPFQVRLSAEEKGSMVFNTMRLVGEALSVSILLTFDWIFYEFLMLIQRHAHVTYYQTGVHHIKMTIYGDGFVGSMVRSILKGFDKKHTTAAVTTTEACLPQPSKLPTSSVFAIYGLFLFLFLLMLIQSYALRLRRVICSFFYQKREKKRVLFLYNDRMKKRRSYMEHMRKRVRKAAREQAIALETGVFLSLRHLYPKIFGWLGKCGLGKRKCLVCEEVESTRTPFVFCSDECPFCYCLECWKDMKGNCYVCQPDEDEDSPLSDENSNDESF